MQIIVLIFVLALLVLALLAATLVLCWAAMKTAFAEEDEKIVNTAADPGSAKQIKIMSWNIAWCYGVGSEGSNYSPRSKTYFLEKLESVAQTIKDSGADIVLLQEVDFDSDKSHNIDQLKWLAEKLGMSRARAVSWNVNYLPFPHWPFADHFRKVVSGGGVLSRFPIKENHIHLWDKPKNNSWWYNLFYLHRYTQSALIEINGKLWEVLNNHLEAFDKDNRQAQAREAARLARASDKLLAVGGDFNTTPPQARRKHGFEHVRDDYRHDHTYEIFSGSPGLRDALAEHIYLQDESRWFTFSSVKPSRKLDYIFAPKARAPGEFEVVRSVASDHFAVVATLSLEGSGGAS